jgi:hypothetical protein
MTVSIAQAVGTHHHPAPMIPMERDVLRSSILGRQSSSAAPVRRAAARCLFGPPDMMAAKKLVDEVQSNLRRDFEKRWNFPVTDSEGFQAPMMMMMAKEKSWSHKPPAAANLQGPATANKVQTSAVAQVGQPSRYEWGKAYSADYMAKCNRDRFEAPLAPHKYPICLLYAPTLEPKKAEEEAGFTTQVASKQLTAPGSANPLSSTSVQTEDAEVKKQVDQGTQTPPPAPIEKEVHHHHHHHHECCRQSYESTCNSLSKKRRIALEPLNAIPYQRLLEMKSCPTSPCTSTNSVAQNRKDNRPLARARPLTILPLSPDDTTQNQRHHIHEHEDILYPEDEECHDEEEFKHPLYPLSPVDHVTPPPRRNSVGGVFTFPESPSSSIALQGLRIRNGSPMQSFSADNKRMKQRSITGKLYFISRYLNTHTRLVLVNSSSSKLASCRSCNLCRF